MLRKMGVKVEPLDADTVEITLKGGDKLVFREPQVIVVTARGQPPMFYVVGEYEKVRAEAREAEAGEALEISEEDVRIVAEQAGVSLEEARRALEEAGGDLAEAILRLKERRGG
jgi:nascent polypeptide-associated complex subunit alpha